MSPVYIQKLEKNVLNLHKIKQRITIRLFDCIKRERQPMQKCVIGSVNKFVVLNNSDVQCQQLCNYYSNRAPNIFNQEKTIGSEQYLFKSVKSVVWASLAFELDWKNSGKRFSTCFWTTSAKCPWHWMDSALEFWGVSRTYFGKEASWHCLKQYSTQEMSIVESNCTFLCWILPHDADILSYAECRSWLKSFWLNR